MTKNEIIKHANLKPTIKEQLEEANRLLKEIKSEYRAFPKYTKNGGMVLLPVNKGNIEELQKVS
jgi:hypothetical protein